MKKLTLGAIIGTGVVLFSLQLRSLSVQAEETTMSTDAGIVDTLPGSGIPDIETEIGGTETPNLQPEQPESPVEQPETPTIQSEPELPEPTLPSKPIDGIETTEPSQPIGSSESTEPETPSTEASTIPSTSEESTEKPSEESTQPVEKTKEEPMDKPSTPTPAKPEKEITVTVTPSGQVTPNKDHGTSVPIVTSDVEELTHIPTPTTPLKAATGQSIVGVLDGVPLVQNDQGELVKDLSIPVKKLPSGNIEVKTADGQTKVLPKTGENAQAVLSILGVLITSIASLFGYKRNQKYKV
ncbi:LPXTG cell wall anchor domain-containing protein [Enterococcus faecium]|uniref:Gram-positive cocci surface proteins LPxTG domain-containing protein n=1 Tax=Enterococcus faecium TaxID=1352 RepID=A0A242AZW9_ENTFC|nr:LPXTG cell wall anchor domain-containing protein [Enterococcus faecium]OTN86632.1 hypothetical protein A5810_003030 [Enterococcus faecium]